MIEVEMMNKASSVSSKGVVLVKLKKTHEPMMMIGTCYGSYPALVLSPLRSITFIGTKFNYPCVVIKGVEMEAYNKYCEGAKEVKVTTPKFFSVDCGETWLTSEQFYQLS